MTQVQIEAAANVTEEMIKAGAHATCANMPCVPSCFEDDEQRCVRVAKACIKAALATSPLAPQPQSYANFQQQQGVVGQFDFSPIEGQMVHNQQQLHIVSMTKLPKRPRDPAQLAKFIVDVATGVVEESHGKAPNRAKGGIKGGRARAKALTPSQRSEIARAASVARWKKS